MHQLDLTVRMVQRAQWRPWLRSRLHRLDLRVRLARFVLWLLLVQLLQHRLAQMHPLAQKDQRDRTDRQRQQPR